MDHFLKPRHVGEVAREPGAVGRGEATNDECGDTAVVEVRVEGGVVAEARFRSKGCAGAIASCSAAMTWLTGRSVDEANAIDADAVDRVLEGLPASKRGCEEMAVRAARAALAAARG